MSARRIRPDDGRFLLVVVRLLIEAEHVVHDDRHRLEELRPHLGDDLLDRLDGVDAPADLTRQRNRSLHVAAEIEIGGASKLTHDVVLAAKLDTHGPLPPADGEGHHEGPRVPPRDAERGRQGAPVRE